MYLELFDELIRSEFKILPRYNVYELEETKLKPLQKKIKTRLKAHGKNLLYKFDSEGHDLFPFFNSIRKVKKMSDYIALIEYKDRLFAFVIELSSTKEKETQYAASKHFVEYIAKCCARINNNIANKQLLKPYFQYIVIVNLPTSKWTTGVKNITKHSHKTGKDLDLTKYCILPKDLSKSSRKK